MRLDDDELEVAAIALKSVQQPGHIDGHTELGGYYLRRAAALVKRIEQFQKDRENGDV